MADSRSLSPPLVSRTSNNSLAALLAAGLLNGYGLEFHPASLPGLPGLPNPPTHSFNCFSYHLKTKLSSTRKRTGLEPF